MMLSYSPCILTAIAALLVTCHAQCKCTGNSELPAGSGLFGKAGLKAHLASLSGFLGLSGDLTARLKKDDCPCPQGLSVSLNTELWNVLVNLKHRISRLEGVLFLNGKMRQVGDKVFASNGKNVDFASALKFCEEAGGTLATPTNEEENKAILGIVKEYNQYAYLGIKESETSGQFKCLRGGNLRYTKWRSHEPNGKGREKCVEMYTDGSWNDKKCNLYRLTICEF